MNKGYFVKYTGINASVNHNGQYLNPYNFRPGTEKHPNWVEVHELDFEWYKKKAKKNSTWHVKEDKVAKVVTKYFAKFLGLADKKGPMEIIRYEDDSLKTKERTLVFPVGEWQEIQQIDVAFFKKKAVNDFWEYDKKIITEKLKEVKVTEPEPEEVEVTEPKPKKKEKVKKEPELEPIVEPVIESKEDEE